MSKTLTLIEAARRMGMKPHLGDDQPGEVVAADPHPAGTLVVTKDGQRSVVLDTPITVEVGGARRKFEVIWAAAPYDGYPGPVPVYTAPTGDDEDEAPADDDVDPDEDEAEKKPAPAKKAAAKKPPAKKADRLPDED